MRVHRRKLLAVVASLSIAGVIGVTPAQAAPAGAADDPTATSEPTDGPTGTTPPGTPSTTPNPTTSPSQTPTRTPTPTPTPTLTDRPTPTDEPTSPSEPPSTPPPSKPTDKPTQKPPSTPPSTPPSKPPSQPSSKPSSKPPSEPSKPPPSEPTGEPRPTAPPDDGYHVPDDLPEDPELAYQRALLGAQTLAVAEAQRVLARVMAELDAAQKGYVEASAAADTARIADTEMRRQLGVAEHSVARTEREISDLLARTETTREALGAVAREAYKGNGLATLGVVLGSETPAQLTDRYVGMRTLMRTGDSTLGRMAVDEAQLRDAHARLEGQRQELQASADRAAEARAAKEQAEQEALAAQSTLDQTSALVQSALKAAQDAELEDYRKYMELLNQSTAIGERLAGIDYGPGFGSGTFVLPATGATTSEYGPRLHPILGYVKIHTGLDFGRGDGSIYAADSGTVVEATWNDAYGYMVIVDHGTFEGQRLTTMYAHQSELSVAVGQKVRKGQVIGSIGSTGYSTGPHLHFEVRLDGEHTDPWPWVQNASPPG